MPNGKRMARRSDMCDVMCRYKWHIHMYSAHIALDICPCNDIPAADQVDGYAVHYV